MVFFLDAMIHMLAFGEEFVVYGIKYALLYTTVCRYCMSVRILLI